MASTSSSRSPMPRMIPDLVVRPASSARASTPRLRAYPAEGRTARWSRATVSMLWLRTSGRASKMVLSDSSSPLQSEISTSMVVAGVRLPDGGDGGGKGAGTSVGQVVTGHAGDHGMGQPHPLHRLGHPLRLTGVEGKGMAGVHLAEPARPGAPRAVDHEGGGAVRPALVDVGATGLLAHRDQVEVPQIPGGGRGSRPPSWPAPGATRACADPAPRRQSDRPRPLPDVAGGGRCRPAVRRPPPPAQAGQWRTEGPTDGARIGAAGHLPRR